MSTIYGPDPTYVDWHQFGLAEPEPLPSLSPGGLSNGQEIAEVTVHAPAGLLRVWALMADAPDLPLLTPHGPGALRVHARGRDIAYDAALTDEVVEEYFLQIWPGPPASEVIYKQTDECGAGHRRSTALNAARLAGQGACSPRGGGEHAGWVRG